jgi:hypothetical protein
LVVGWIWLGFWTSAKPKEPPQPARAQWTVGYTGEESGRGVLVSELLKRDGPELEADPKPKRAGLERYRNGWTFVVATIFAIVVSWLCVFVSPYWWL